MGRARPWFAHMVGENTDRVGTGRVNIEIYNHVCITLVILHAICSQKGLVEISCIILKVRPPRILIYPSTGPTFILPNHRILVDPVCWLYKPFNI